VDGYIFVWFLLMVACYLWLLPRHPRTCALLATWRLIDIFQANVNMHVFDAVRLGSSRHHVASVLRSAMISAWNFIEQIGWFGLVYYWDRELTVPCVIDAAKRCMTDQLTAMDSLYFSGVTQLTIGYGDLTPVGISRGIAVGQGLAGALFVLFALSRFASMLPGVKSDREQRESRPCPRPGTATTSSTKPTAT
jgi:hypothetical protein